MPTYPFLSDEWITAARDIREEYRGKTPAMTQVIKMNQVVTDVPFGDGDIKSHMDSSSGEMEMELGHLDDAEVTITVDYATAKAIFVDQNPQVAMQAFMAGKIKVQGDMTKLMAMQQSGIDPLAAEVAGRIKAITE